MKVVHITGAGTEIGKTHVACALIEAWRERGVICKALKPVVSGFEPKCIAETDTGRLITAMGEAATMRLVEEVSPWRFAAPAAPPLAARAEGVALSFAEIVSGAGLELNARTGECL